MLYKKSNASKYLKDTETYGFRYSTAKVLPTAITTSTTARFKSGRKDHNNKMLI